MIIAGIDLIWNIPALRVFSKFPPLARLSHEGHGASFMFSILMHIGAVKTHGRTL